MIVNNESKEQLKIILWNYIKFQETYNEVYDHVLTALESKHDATLSFEANALAVITADFGGILKLKDLERRGIKAIHNQVARKHIHNALNYFKFPSIAYTALLTILTYYVANTKFISVVLLAAVFIMLTPTILVGVRVVKKALSEKTGKPSIKDNMFNLTGIYGVVLYNAINATAITRHLKLHQLSQWHIGAIVLVILFYTIYGLSFIKLYRDEVKTQMAL
jgi:hypothetical protein